MTARTHTNFSVLTSKAESTVLSIASCPLVDSDTPGKVVRSDQAGPRLRSPETGLGQGPAVQHWLSARQSRGE